MPRDVENSGGLNAPISDSPPSGYYAQMRQALSSKGKALLAVSALALVGVVAAIAATTTGGDNINSEDPVNSLGSGNPEDSNSTGGGGGNGGFGQPSAAPSMWPSAWPTTDTHVPSFAPSPWPTPTDYTCEVNCPAPNVFSPVVPEGRPVTTEPNSCERTVAYSSADLTSDYCDCDFDISGALETTAGGTTAHLTAACATTFHLALRRICALICDDLDDCDAWRLTGDRCEVFQCGNVDFEPSVGDISGFPCRPPPTNAPSPAPTTAKPSLAPSRSPVTSEPSASPTPQPTQPTPQPTEPTPSPTNPTPPPVPTSSTGTPTMAPSRCRKRWDAQLGAFVCRT